MAISLRDRGWQLFDEIVDSAPLAGENPWTRVGDDELFIPDYATLERLLGVPVYLSATSQSGVPALALDVWVSYELRRAGFDGDRVWPRASEPRVMPYEVTQFIAGLPVKLRSQLADRVRGGKVVGAAKSANLLGKNYVKQVDVVMSSWATGPELMISTKRMDSSFGKNAANRVEESYGDAKNLRLRHPQAALGFVYALSAISLVTERDTALWLIDLLQKLGREDDAYDAVALVMPDLAGEQEPTGAEEPEPAGPLEAGAVDDDESELPVSSEPPADRLEDVVPVSLYTGEIPNALDPGRFFAVMCARVLDNSPINFHTEARRRRANPVTGPR
ncbi:MAG TPA: hypothetical protein VG502_11320 [Flexivirga sp.]|uniref:hypothetical protein n=1 Tax=Flexivirga sp. TaxID=1962927 RepID=UPI002BB39047|nr:hypothetical protein [Flexivirga sp.]HWC22880.1 hypothetical protein [Flexivirga sp.]